MGLSTRKGKSNEGEHLYFSERVDEGPLVERTCGELSRHGITRAWPPRTRWTGPA